MERALVIPILTTLLTVAAGPAHGGDMLAPGDRFPTFELEAHDGSTINSGALAGQTFLLFFYPKAETPGCTKEACRLRDSWTDLRELGVTVLGVSYDTPESNRRFAEKHRLPFPLLSDRSRELASAVGATRLLLPVPKRISYLIGPDGVVLKAYPSVSPSDHADHVLHDLEEMRQAGLSDARSTRRPDAE